MKTTSIRKILVPIDFSKMSVKAIDIARAFAQRFGATVHLAHVHKFSYPAGFSAPMPPVIPYSAWSYDDGAEKEVGRELNSLAKKHCLSPGAAHLLTGSPAFDEICRLAKNLPADLIVMPTHGRTGFRHVFLGSTAERIVQHSPCPVLITRKRKKHSNNGAGLAINTILVPIDFSRCSLAGLKYAIGFAEKFVARLILLHVIPYYCTSNGWVTYEITEATRAAEKEAESRMRDFVSAAKFGTVEFETVIADGNAVDKICDYARQHYVDLIVTSTHGRTGLKHVLMGSVAENVIRRAGCSVLTVPSFARVQTTKMRPGRGKQRQSMSRRTTAEAPRPLIAREKLTRKYRKLTAHKFPERRKTNRFRETHLVS